MTGVAVTGSRYFVERGQDQQKRSFITELRGLYLDGVSTLHHGDAVGADAFSHQIAVFLGLGIVVHPPENSTHRAFCSTGKIRVLPTKPYLDRNIELVTGTEALLVLPIQNQEVQRSGTWHTVRVARKMNRSIVIFFPDGRVSREN